MAIRQSNFQQMICFLALTLVAILGGCGGGTTKKVRPLSEQMNDARALTNPADRSLALLKVADGYLAAADDLGARNCLMLASEAADEISLKRAAAQRANIYIQIAAGWHQAGQTQNCEDSYKDASKAIRKISDPVDKTDALTQLGTFKITIDKKSSAAKDFKTALVESDKIEDPMERVRLVGAVAQGYTKLEQPNDAKQIMASALKLGEAEKDPAKKARLLALIGKQQIDFLGDNQAGMETLEKARQVAGSIENNPNKQANALIVIAATYKDLHKKHMARSLLNEAEKLCRGRSECKPAMKRIAKLRDQM